MRRALPIVLLVSVLVWPIADIRAHGHPVSNGLINGNVYVPSNAPTPALANALTKSVESVYARHFRIKVAVVAGPVDLGSLSPLWKKPYRYASHLATDLNALFVGPFLIVMPNGFAIYDGGRSVTPERRVLAHVKISRRDPDGLTRAATDAVRRLLRAGALRSKDIRAPRTYAFRDTVRRGTVTPLQFTVREDSEWSRVVARIVTDSGVITTHSTGLVRVNPTKPLIFRWSVPSTLPGEGVRLCVVASDETGNRGDETCSDLKVE